MSGSLQELLALPSQTFVFDDGGREAAGFRGSAGDCVCRAIAIALEMPYIQVYNDLADRMAKAGKSRSARNGINKEVYKRYLRDTGWVWTPTMLIGSGCTTHLNARELPKGRLVVSVSKHLVAVVDGVIRDTYDPSRGGTRCVYGYWRAP